MSLEQEILRLVGERNRISRQLLEKIMQDTKSGRITPEEAVSLHEMAMKELEITQGFLDRQTKRLEATKKREKNQDNAK